MLTLKDEDELREALIELKEQFDGPSTLFACTGFSEELIEDIVEQSQFIFTLQDLTKTSPVFFIKTHDCCSRGFCRNVPRHIGIRRSCYIVRSRIFA